MKTAMQEMLERVKEYRDLETSLPVVSRLNSIYVDLLGMLEKEKEQIVGAHYQGYRESIGTTEVSEEYYEQTYGGKK